MFNKKPPADGAPRSYPKASAAASHEGHASNPDAHHANQLPLPPSFVALFVAPGASRPSASRAVITERHEWCDDLAQMLTETASNKLWELGINETEVLDRVHQGLLEPGAPVSPPEAGWVVCRLAELLGWPLPSWAVLPLQR
jgi:hypothetical protein